MSRCKNKQTNQMRAAARRRGQPVTQAYHPIALLRKKKMEEEQKARELEAVAVLTAALERESEALKLGAPVVGVDPASG